MYGSISLCIAQNKVDSFIKTSGSINDHSVQLQKYFEFAEKIALLNFDESQRLAEAGLILAMKYKNETYAARFERLKGEALYFKGKYNMAAQEFYKSIKLLEANNEKKPLAETYNALAKLYRKTRDLPQALQNYDKAMSIYKFLKDSAGLSAIYNESGVVFEYGEKYEEAARRYRISLEIDKRRNDLVGVCYALSNLAGVYILQNKFSIAEEYLQQSLTIRKQMNDSFAIALNYSDLASAYISTNELLKTQLYIDSSNCIANRMKYNELISTNYELLGRVAENGGNFKDALNFYKKNTVLKDSLYNLDKEKQIAELNTRYETEKKERTITEQNNRLRIQYIIFIAAIVSLLLASLFIYNLYRKNKLKREAREREELLIQNEIAAKAVMQAEEAERYRIARDLHDGVGQIMSAAKMNLSAYQSRINFKNEDEKKSFENIITLVDISCKEVRAVSHKMMPIALTDKKLDTAVQDFIDKLDKDSLKIHFYSEGFEESIPAEVETVLYRIIQECVHNVIKHSEADQLDISLLREKNELTATIEDNGKGFVCEGENSKKGIGLKNIKSRVAFINGEAEFTSAPGKGTLVAIHVPL